MFEIFIFFGKTRPQAVGLEFMFFRIDALDSYYVG